MLMLDKVTQGQEPAGALQLMEFLQILTYAKMGLVPKVPSYPTNRYLVFSSYNIVPNTL